MKIFYSQKLNYMSHTLQDHPKKIILNRFGDLTKIYFNLFNIRCPISTGEQCCKMSVSIDVQQLNVTSRNTKEDDNEQHAERVKRLGKGHIKVAVSTVLAAFQDKITQLLTRGSVQKLRKIRNNLCYCQTGQLVHHEYLRNCHLGKIYPVEKAFKLSHPYIKSDLRKY